MGIKRFRDQNQVFPIFWQKWHLHAYKLRLEAVGKFKFLAFFLIFQCDTSIADCNWNIPGIPVEFIASHRWSNSLILLLCKSPGPSSGHPYTGHLQLYYWMSLGKWYLLSTGMNKMAWLFENLFSKNIVLLCSVLWVVLAKFQSQFKILLLTFKKIIS